MARNLFLESNTFINGNDRLGYVNHNALKEDNKEFLRTDVFDFEFTVPPTAVYFPGNDKLHLRLTGVDLAVPTGLSEISANIRGYTIRQTVYSGTTSGTITLNFVDREDQAISRFIDDWREKFGDREHRYAFRKEDTVADGKLVMMNSSRIPIREYIFYNLQPNDGTGTLNPAFASDDPQQAGICSLPLTFEHFKIEYFGDD